MRLFSSNSSFKCLMYAQLRVSKTSIIFPGISSPNIFVKAEKFSEYKEDN